MGKILRYGISFQSTAILDVIATWTTPALVGILIGPHAVGYLGVAQANARRPLMLAESVMRVSFSHFSRLQTEIQRLQNTVNNYLVGFLWVMLLWMGFLWTSGSPLVEIIYSAKWLPAVPALVVFAIALPFDMIIWAMSLCYRAMNRNWSAVRIFGSRTILMLALSAFLIPQIGFVGMPWAYLVANMVCTVLLLKNFAPGFLMKLFRNCAWLFPCLVLACISGRAAIQLAGPSNVFVNLLAGAVPFTVTYLLVSLILAPEPYRQAFFQMLRSALPARRDCSFNGIAPRPQSLAMIVMAGLLSTIFVTGPATTEAAAARPQQAAGPAENYALGVNDQVTIQALDADEISGKTYTVSPTGYLTLPMIGRLRVVGLTVEQVEAELIQALKVYIRQPEVAVTVTEFHSQPVSVIGAVNTPGVLQLQGTKTLIEVLSMAGGLRSDAGHTVMITRKQEWGRLPLPGAQFDTAGQVSTAEIQMNDVLEARDPELNIVIRPNDIISIPRAEVVYVLGAVNKAGGFMLNERGAVSVLQALSLAEGLQRTSDPKKAIILRVADGAPTRSELPVDIAGIFAGKTEDIFLQPNDILFVPDSSGKRVAARVFEALVSMGTTVGAGTIIYRR
jgi:polysaccharide export outer membrane protein